MTNLLKIFSCGLLFLLSSLVFSQITGKVEDELGPLENVRVYIPSKNLESFTDSNGDFMINGVIGDKLNIEHPINLNVLEYTVDKRDLGTITLSSKEVDLDVVIGYGTQKKSELTTSITSISEDEFNSGGTTNPLNLIQGKVAGLSITNTRGSNPNSGPTVQLRGIVSYTGTNSPLYVIDGIPGGNLDLLQNDDIESIDVLKDGSAAAIYGTRANAGVIIITTKKGKKGIPSFEYNNYLQREFVAKKLEYLSADEYREAIKNYDGGKFNTPENDKGSNVDMFEELLNKENLSQYHNFSVSGGTDNSNYRASVFYMNSEGIAKANDKEEFGGRIHYTQKGLDNRLTVQSNLAANFNYADLLGGNDFENSIIRNPTWPIYNDDGTFFQTYGWGEYNPLSRLAYREYERRQHTLNGDMRIAIELLPKLTVAVFGAYQLNTYNDRYFRSSQDFDNRPEGSYKGMSYASKNDNLWIDKTFDATVNYNFKLQEDHQFETMVGYSYQYRTWEYIYANNNGFSSDAYKDWNLGAGSAIYNDRLPRVSLGSDKEDDKLIAFFGRLNYNYLNKYFLQAVFRREGSSRFGINNKWGNFPALSIGWIISKEDFMAENTFFDYLKLRAGYGVTGNQGIPNYLSLTLLGTGGVYPQIPQDIGNYSPDGVNFEQTYGPRINPNPNLKWELKQELNFGLDFRVLNNKLNGSIDLYNRTTKDLLYSYNVSQPSYIHNTMWVNVGAIESKGIELMLDTDIINRNDFNYNLIFTANFQSNKIKKLSNDSFKLNDFTTGGIASTGNLGNAYKYSEGTKIGDYYGYKFAGFTDDGKWQFYKADGSIALADEVNDDDKTNIGNGAPKYMASLTNNFKYKNFDLTIFFRGKFDYEILNVKDMLMGNLKWLPNNVLKSALTKHNNITEGPRYSDYYLEKGDFVKLDNLTLGYNLDFNSNYIKSLRVFLTGRNLITLTGYSGIDPEVNDANFDPGLDGLGFYPRTRSWTIGLNVKF